MKIAYVPNTVFPWEIGGVQKRVQKIGHRLPDHPDVYWYRLNHSYAESSFPEYCIDRYTTRTIDGFTGPICMTGELVSIIIPTHFRNEGLRETLQSVREQVYEPIEVIVVDDSGDGHARDVVDEFEEVLYIRFPNNRGAQAARNAGLRLAISEYVWFLDDDDRLRSTAVSKQVTALREHPNAGVAVCGIEFTHGGFHLPTSNASRLELERALEFWNGPFRYSTVLVERSVLDTIAPLDETFEGAGDIWMRIELAQITDFVAVEEPLVLVAKREQQMEAGENADHLGFSRAALEARWKMFDRYAALYDKVDPIVRRNALADAYRLEALLHLHSRSWSPRAILAFARTAYYTPTNRPQHMAELAASFFGRPGHKLTRNLRDGAIRRVDRLRGRE